MRWGEKQRSSDGRGGGAYSALFSMLMSLKRRVRAALWRLTRPKPTISYYTYIFTAAYFCTENPWKVGVVKSEKQTKDKIREIFISTSPFKHPNMYAKHFTYFLWS